MLGPPRRQPFLLSVLFVVFVVGSLVVAGGSATAASGVNATTATNETVHHEQPSDASGSGDMDSVRDWLSDELSSRLEDSALQLSQGQYEAADSVLGEEFEDRLGQFVDVTGETDDGDSGGGDDGDGGGTDENESAAEAFETAQTEQRELTNQTEAFNETRREYRRSNATGNDSRARMKARELATLANQINRTTGNVTQAYGQLKNQTDANLSTARNSVRQLSENISEQVQEIQNRTLVETALSVQSNRSTAAYTRPVTLSGQLLTAAETPVGNRTVALAVGDQVRRVITDQSGNFSLVYRPRTIPADAARVRLQYIPRQDSQYLRAETTVALDIQQTEATLTSSNVPKQLRYQRPATVDVALTVDGRPVRNVPISFSLAGESAGNVRTATNGTVRTSLQIGAAIPAGNTTLAYGVPGENRAVTAPTVTERVQIVPTDTALSLAVNASGENATVTGRLTTADGRPVGDAVVAVSANDSTLTQVRTDGAGRYQTVTELPVDRSTGTATVELSATYSGDGSNLRSARQSMLLTVDLSATSSSPNPSPSREPNESDQNQLSDAPTWLVAVGGVFILGVIGVFYRSRRTTQSSASGDTGSDDAVELSKSQPDFVDRQLQRAESLADGGEYRDAVTTAYVAFRQSLDQPAPSRTHREFYDHLQASESLNDDAESRLRTMTELYEKAVYTPAQTVETDAREAMDTVRALVTDETASESRSAD